MDQNTILIIILFVIYLIIVAIVIVCFIYPFYKEPELFDYTPSKDAQRYYNRQLAIERELKYYKHRSFR